MDIFNDHKKLYLTASSLFIGLTILVAILPALNNQDESNYISKDENAMTQAQQKGKEVFISNGCVACHTQQVRNIDMDKSWGKRPGIPSDYADNHRISLWVNTATLMGTERTGPDLTNVGERQPSLEWHLLHLYQPRAVVHQSIMPAYKFLFEVKTKPTKYDVVINVPEKYFDTIKGKVVATRDALNLVAYLQSLKQRKLPDGTPERDFLYKPEAKPSQSGGVATATLDGAALYSVNCMSCHQQNGEGLKGAFPPLKASAIVNNDNPEMMITIIMKGYNPRPEFAEMPPVGTNNNLTPEKVAAIINHERSSWGNNTRKIPIDEVKKIMDFIKQEKN